MDQASHLSRYRPAVISVATIAAAFGIYTIYSVYSGSHSTSSLRRSNAVHRPRRDQRHAVRIDRLPPTPDAPLGMIVLRKGDDAYIINLASSVFPTTEDLRQIYQPPVDEDVRQRIGVAAIDMILHACFKAANEHDNRERIEALGFGELMHAMAARDDDQVMVHARRIAEIPPFTGITEQQITPAIHKFLTSDRWLAAMHDTIGPDPAETEDMDATDTENKEPSHGLRGLLYYIAEEDAKRKAYEHRGIRCEECGEMPIRGIRYHCLNCPDYDLCPSCEQHTEHVKTHVFAKIRIPLPILSQPTKEYRCWYPGDPRKIHGAIEPHLRKQMCQDHGYEEPEMDALYDQFVANANVPFGYAHTSVKAAIDRRAFNRALTRETWSMCCAANPMYDRMYAFYDTDMNGIIDFEEFLSGVAYLRGPKRFSTLDRAIRGYDMDGDGFVDRADFMRLLRAKYEIQQQLVRDMVEGQEIEQTLLAAETLQSSQPISSVFSQEDIPPGESRPRRGKELDVFGDMQPLDEIKTLLDDADPFPSNGFSRSTFSSQSTSRFEELLHGSLDGAAPALPSDDLQEIDGLPRQVPPDNTQRRPKRRSRDVGTDPHVPDIIWQTVEDGMNELLDKIFKAREDEDHAVEATRESRERWGDQIAATMEEERREHEEMVESAKSDPLVATALNAGVEPKAKAPPQQNGDHRIRRQMVPTDRASLDRREQEISDASLVELLDSSGFQIRDSSRVVTSPRAAHIGASSIWDGLRNAATSPLRTVTSSDDDEPVDPTLPQHRPNVDPDIAPKAKKTPPALPERPPSKERLRYLAGLGDAAEQLKARGGPGRLTYAEVEAMAVADKSGELRGLIKSWLEYASF